MKIFLMMAACLLSFSALTAQQINNDTAVNKTNYPVPQILALICQEKYAVNKTNYPVPQKGYYSIYNNAEKLAPAGTMVDGNATVRKGFFAIGENHKKIARSREGYRRQQPVVTKGYYAIGDNSKKL